MTRVLMAPVLCMAGASRAETRREGEALFLSVPGTSWELKVPARGLDLKDEQRRDNGTGVSYLYQNAGMGLLFSVSLEPAVSCRTSRECREMV